MTNYRFETFEPVVDDKGVPDVQTAAYLQIVTAGFHDRKLNDEALVKKARRTIADKRVLTAVYADQNLPYAYEPHTPVATFAHFEKKMNVGGGRLIPTHLITWVTVRPTHRRRGLLRSLMTANLTEAKAAGYPLAALTVTEGDIYTRFGFGTSTWMSTVEIDTSPGFKLACEPDRRVEMCSASVLTELAPQIYERFMQRSPGAIERQQAYVDMASGTVNPETGEEDRDVRAALHYDEDGNPDGYVSYKFKGWKTDPPTVEVIDLIAVSDAAYSSLWAFVAAIDLVDRVIYDEAAQTSPLPWLVDNPRRVKIKDQHDAVWLRVLDVEKALEARPWPVAGQLTIRVRDDMNLADGTFSITASGGSAAVEAVSASHAVDLELGVAELGSIYLGGADPVILARAGRITEHTEDASVRARELFALERAPYGPNGF